MTIRRVEAMARELLKADGFADLEAGGLFSNRGRFGGRRDDDRRRMEDGARYTEWATAVLWNGRFPLPFDREVWRLHAEGLSREDSLPLLVNRWPNVTEWQIQLSAANTRRRHVIGRGRGGTDGTQPITTLRRKIRQLIREADTDALIGLAKVLMEAT